MTPLDLSRGITVGIVSMQMLLWYKVRLLVLCRNKLYIEVYKDLKYDQHLFINSLTQLLKAASGCAKPDDFSPCSHAPAASLVLPVWKWSSLKKNNKQVQFIAFPPATSSTISVYALPLQFCYLSISVKEFIFSWHQIVLKEKRIYPLGTSTFLFLPFKECGNRYYLHSLMIFS